MRRQFYAIIFVVEMTRETAVWWDLCEFELRRRGYFLRGLASEDLEIRSWVVALKRAVGCKKEIDVRV